MSAQDQRIDRTRLNRVLPTTARLSVTNGASAREISGTSPNVTTRLGEIIVARLPETAKPTHLFHPLSVRGTALEPIALPLRFIAPGANGAPDAFLRPVALIENGGLTLDRVTGAYKGSFLLGVEDSLAAAARPANPSMGFAITADRATVDPAQTTIAMINVGFQRVELNAADPGDSVAVLLHPAFSHQEVRFVVPVRRSRVAISVAPGSIRGFGLQTAEVIARVPRADLGRSVSLVLRSNRGIIDPNPLIVDSTTGQGVAMLRSEGIGSVVLQAEGDGLESGRVEPRFEWPTLFVLSALIGGGIGGFLRHLSNRERGSSRRNRHVLFGTLIGAVAAASYAEGIRLINVNMTAPYGSEASVFVIASLTAMALTSTRPFKRLMPGGGA